MSFSDPGKTPDFAGASSSTPGPASPPPPPSGWVLRSTHDGTFVGPIAPPPPLPGPPVARAAPAAAPLPVPEVILALPLGTRSLVAAALDLLTRTDSGLRSASFYLGFLTLVSAGPLVALVAVVYLALGDSGFAARGGADAWAGWALLASIPAGLGYLAVSVESRALATAVIGGRAEGRPLRLRESIAVARRRFWPVLWGQLIAGIAVGIGSAVVSSAVDGMIGQVADIDTGVQLVAGVVFGAPFVYITAGIVLGEVGLFESIGRSFRLFGARRRLALAVSAFGALSQFIILFGVSIGLDSTARLAVGAEWLGRLPAPLAVPVIAALAFAFGTLTFIVAAIAAAPAVYAFAALTHYTHGLELGRQRPLAVHHAWDPYLTRGMAVAAIIALGSLVAGVLALPG